MTSAAAEARGAPWTPRLRDRLSKLLLMLGSETGERENAGRMIAQDVDLHEFAEFVRHGDPPGASDAVFAAFRPFLKLALGEVRAGAWALSGDEPAQLRRVAATLDAGAKLDAAGITALWLLLTAVRKRVGRQ